jgi:hypothetical protein
MSMFRPLILSHSPRTRPRILRAKRCMLYLKTVRHLSVVVGKAFKENRPLLIHTTEIIAPLNLDFENDGEKAERSPYLHVHIKCIASHPFRVGTSWCLWMGRHRHLPAPKPVHEFFRPQIPVLTKMRYLLS